MAIDTSSLMLALSGLYGNSSYGDNLLSGGSSVTNSFQNILLSSLLGGSSALTTGGCPYCAAVYGNADSTTATGLKTAGNAKATGQELNTYFEEAEKEYGVSADLLRAVAKVGSGYDINAEGDSGAQGLMQLMPAMAEQMDIEDVYDARENIMGAARSLARKLEFNGGDVEQAVRSYYAANVASAHYNGADVQLSLDKYVEQVLKYAEQDLTEEVAASQTAVKSSGTAQERESVFTADDAKYLAEMARLQMQMQSMAAFNTSLNGSGSSGGLI